MKLVECVPNFSEGRDKTVIDAIVAAIRSVSGVEMLDVDPGVDTNRTVVTFIGEPAAVLEGAFRGAAKSAELIDMSKHQGAHARMGACDVCPFVPLQGVTMAECVELAKAHGRRVGEELGIPVFLYEEAATKPERRNLSIVRQGEYEGLPEKLKDPAWAPDFGPARFHQKSGAFIIGAREFLVAFNFNLNTRDSKIAHDIALDIRESGRAAKNEKGETIKDALGKSVMRPGKFKFVKAVGWYMENFHCAQISMNLINYKQTPLASVFDEVCRLSETRGIRCTGSELVGLVPKDCLLEAGRHYLRRAGKSAGVPEKEIIRVAVQSLGLNELYPFEPDKKIVERRIPDPRPLISKSVGDFVDETSSDSPAPGGGSVAALCGALSSALCAMVAQLTVGKKGHEEAQEGMKSLAVEAQAQKDFFLRAIDDDTAAFNALMTTFKLPKDTPEKKTERDRAIQKATQNAIEVPKQVLFRAQKAVELAGTCAKSGNQNSLSDAGVAALCAVTAAEGAYYNVVINLAAISDRSYVDRTLLECDKMLQTIRSAGKELLSHLETTLKTKLAR
jgi:glutamate formiminotransferase / formiminotetrahydrofolate cyclodeaminase